MDKYIGVMSGTSLDGIDTVLVETDGRQICLLAADGYPLPGELRARLLAAAGGQAVTMQAVGQMDAELGQLYARAVNQLLAKARVTAAEVTAIGCHGQTLWHQPEGPLPFSLQLGDGNRIAADTGILTVNDFRRMDMALGGQGAPLVPAFHKMVLGNCPHTRIVLNIGGIANISVLTPAHKVLGYDVGPGNMLMDAWCQRHTGHAYDKDAELAARGRVDTTLLNKLLGEPWFALPPPKSTGRELFNLAWLDARLPASYRVSDVQATLAELTAVAIADQVGKWPAGELLVCGGGGHNPLLMARLTALLPDWQVSTTNTAGVDMDYMEAMAFAWLAQQTVNGLPGNLPEATGARQGAVLGAIHPAPHATEDS
ncbi:anhydro-N-acetylmuramic acid kinase [Zobellella maritima]|uniref:anhydro-N-acetylmuramic acid kinase n=1 Tax=Zobellella maritima TaxID=2059725 RepID=UPI000E30A6E8|nr:anhydro-N-acetylmuramic acid kinase [Zobellella maritima]